MSNPTAIILTHGYLDTVYAKTCHGLLRGTSRYDIVGVIDYQWHGHSTTSLLGHVQDLTVTKDIDSFISNGGQAEWCIVGVAFEGGRMPENFRQELIDAMAAGMSIVNGLHTLLTEDEKFMNLANQYSVSVIDIRRPKSLSELHFWSGKIKQVEAPRVAVLGMDCAVGKRTTCKMLLDKLRMIGHNVEMIYTGQTGWLEGHVYGCILDSTLNDFVSGELESAVYQCDKNEKPDLILIEGQSALRNPSGPCGSEMIISLQAAGVILQCDPAKVYYDDDPDMGFRLPSVQSEIELIRSLGSEVIAVVLKPSDVPFMEEPDAPVFIANEQGLMHVAEILIDMILK